MKRPLRAAGVSALRAGGEAPCVYTHRAGKVRRCRAAVAALPHLGSRQLHTRGEAAIRVAPCAAHIPRAAGASPPQPAGLLHPRGRSPLHLRAARSGALHPEIGMNPAPTSLRPLLTTLLEGCALPQARAAAGRTCPRRAKRGACPRPTVRLPVRRRRNNADTAARRAVLQPRNRRVHTACPSYSCFPGPTPIVPGL